MGFKTFLLESISRELNWGPLYRGMQKLAAQSVKNKEIRDDATYLAAESDTFWSDSAEYSFDEAESMLDGPSDLMMAVEEAIEMYQDAIKDHYGNAWNFAPGEGKHVVNIKIEFEPISDAKIKELLLKTNKKYWDTLQAKETTWRKEDKARRAQYLKDQRNKKRRKKK